MLNTENTSPGLKRAIDSEHDRSSKEYEMEEEEDGSVNLEDLENIQIRKEQQYPHQDECLESR